MSKLTEWWHDVVDKLDVAPDTKVWLHKYGMYVVWAGMIGGPILLLTLIFRGC